jgi:hypothetical protein
LTIDDHGPAEEAPRKGPRCDHFILPQGLLPPDLLRQAVIDGLAGER